MKNSGFLKLLGLASVVLTCGVTHSAAQATAAGAVYYFSDATQSPPVNWAEAAATPINTTPANTWSLGFVNNANVLSFTGCNLGPTNAVATTQVAYPVSYSQGTTKTITLTSPNIPTIPINTTILNLPATKTTLNLAAPQVQNWRVLTNFSITSFQSMTNTSANSTFRFGVGVLGSNPLFAKSDGSYTGGISYYLIDLTFNVTGGADLSGATPSLRILKFDGSGNPTTVLSPTNVMSNGSSLQIKTGNWCRLIVDGKYDAAGTLTFYVTVSNDSTTKLSQTYNSSSNPESSPFNGSYFGYRHSGDMGSGGSVTVSSSSFVAVNRVNKINSYTGENSFGPGYSVNGYVGNGNSNSWTGSPPAPDPSYSYLEDMAETDLIMGSNNIKFKLNDTFDKLTTGSSPSPTIRNYQEYEPIEAQHDLSITSLAQLAQNGAAVSHVLNMPFANYFFWTVPFRDVNKYGCYWWYYYADISQPWPPPAGNTTTPNATNPYATTTGPAQNEYQQMYDLTQYLLTNYNYTGKSFYLGIWEGDHTFMQYENSTNQTYMFQQMAYYLQIRQQAINDAMANTRHTDVAVYGYDEVNDLTDIHTPSQMFAGYEPGTTGVLPLLTTIPPDYISYSCYDSLVVNAANGTLTNTLNSAVSENGTMCKTGDLGFIQSNILGQMPVNKSVTGTRIFLGEYGFKETGADDLNSPPNLTSAQQAYFSEQALSSALAFGCPFALYWNTYDNPAVITSTMKNGITTTSTRPYTGEGLIESSSNTDYSQNPACVRQSTYAMLNGLNVYLQGTETTFLNTNLKDISQSTVQTDAENWLNNNYGTPP
jgi:hypothetical protein